MNPFARLLHDLIASFDGTKADLARAVGVRPSTISHLLAGTGTPSLELCLRLADITNTSPNRILRAAGKGDVSKLIQRLYGTAAERLYIDHYAGSGRVLRARDAAALKLLSALPKRTVNAFIVLLGAAIPEETRRMTVKGRARVDRSAP